MSIETIRKRFFRRKLLHWLCAAVVLGGMLWIAILTQQTRLLHCSELSCQEISIPTGKTVTFIASDGADRIWAWSKKDGGIWLLRNGSWRRFSVPPNFSLEGTQKEHFFASGQFLWFAGKSKVFRLSPQGKGHLFETKSSPAIREISAAGENAWILLKDNSIAKLSGKSVVLLSASTESSESLDCLHSAIAAKQDGGAWAILCSELYEISESGKAIIRRHGAKAIAGAADLFETADQQVVLAEQKYVTLFDPQQNRWDTKSLLRPEGTNFSENWLFHDKKSLFQVPQSGVLSEYLPETDVWRTVVRDPEIKSGRLLSAVLVSGSSEKVLLLFSKYSSWISFTIPGIYLLCFVLLRALRFPRLVSYGPKIPSRFKGERLIDQSALGHFALSQFLALSTLSMAVLLYGIYWGVLLKTQLLHCNGDECSGIPLAEQAPKRLLTSNDGKSWLLSESAVSALRSSGNSKMVRDDFSRDSPGTDTTWLIAEDGSIVEVGEAQRIRRYPAVLSNGYEGWLSLPHFIQHVSETAATFVISLPDQEVLQFDGDRWRVVLKWMPDDRISSIPFTRNQTFNAFYHSAEGSLWLEHANQIWVYRDSDWVQVLDEGKPLRGSMLVQGDGSSFFLLSENKTQVRRFDPDRAVFDTVYTAANEGGEVSNWFRYGPDGVVAFRQTGLLAVNASGARALGRRNETTAWHQIQSALVRPEGTLEYAVVKPSLFSLDYNFAYLGLLLFSMVSTLGLGQALYKECRRNYQSPKAQSEAVASLKTEGVEFSKNARSFLDKLNLLFRNPYLIVAVSVISPLISLASVLAFLFLGLEHLLAGNRHCCRPCLSAYNTSRRIKALKRLGSGES